MGRPQRARTRPACETAAAPAPQVDASGLVPGDVVLVRLGDVVPADIKLLGEGGEHDTPMQARAQGASLVARLCVASVARRAAVQTRQGAPRPGGEADSCLLAAWGLWQAVSAPAACTRRRAVQHVECVSMSCPTYSVEWQYCPRVISSPWSEAACLGGC